MIRLIRDTKNFITRNLKSLVLFELLYKLTLLLVVLPIFEAGLKKTLNMAGYSYLTIENILPFLRNPATILSIVLFLLMMGFFILLEMNCLSVYFHSCMQLRKIRLVEIFFTGIIHTARELKKKNFLIVLYSTLYGVVLLLPLIIVSISNMRIPSYMVKIIKNDREVAIWVIALVVLAVVAVYDGLFVFQFCNIEKKTFREGRSLSRELKKGRNLRILSVIVAFNILLWIGYAVLYVIVTVVTIVITYVTMDPTVVVAAFLKIYNQMNQYVGFVIAIVSLIGNYGLITKLYIDYRDLNPYAGYEIDKIQEQIMNAEAERLLEKGYYRNIKVPQGRYMVIITVLSIVVIAMNCYNLAKGVYKGAFVERDTLFGSYITSHRGLSSEAPENTIPALELAIDRFSDYAEIDVQETKDGVIILLHDASLKRTTGVKRNIWNVTYEELLTYDAGSWFSSDYIGTVIPTLEEVLDLCRDRIKLNIEIKINGHEQYLIEKVVDLIEEYDFINQCVVTSTSYSALARVKELNENIKTGYIMSIAYGYFYNKEYADFFSVKSSFITESMVRTAHSLGKEVHAWTVNTTTEVERLKQIGVDNIITDNPVKVREIISNANAIVTFKELLGMLEEVN
ncbi:MAG: hypothetical protein E7256_15950 [Lachnospiraceae bacterium]|nr:hypothetical protein [Lachnospiraceae bacterium]